MYSGDIVNGSFSFTAASWSVSVIGMLPDGWTDLLRGTYAATQAIAVKVPTDAHRFIFDKRISQVGHDLSTPYGGLFKAVPGPYGGGSYQTFTIVFLLAVDLSDDVYSSHVSRTSRSGHISAHDPFKPISSEQHDSTVLRLVDHISM